MNMKNIVNIVLLFVIVTITVNAQSGAKGKFLVTYQKDGQEEVASSKGIVFYRDSQYERYAWKPSEWQQSDYATLGTTFDIKNIKSIFRYVESDNHFTVTLPAGSPISEDEITVLAYGQEIPATVDNHYTTGASAVSVVNKDRRIIYESYASVDTINAQRTIELNALETAYTLLLPAFPHIFESTSDEILTVLKTLLSELPETQTLATAIDQSVIRNGYLEMEDIESEYQAAIESIIDKAGLRNNYLKPTTCNASRRAEPRNKPYIINGDGLYGYKLVLNSSEWVENEIGKAWKCNFIAYNSNRFAYTAWLKGYKDNEGEVHYYEYGYDDVRNGLLKPQRASTFMHKFTDPLTDPLKPSSWDGIANYFSDSYKLFFEENFGFEDMTWDNTKKKFDMSFRNSNDVVICAGPAENELVMYYNVVKTVVDPVIKTFAKNFTGAEDEDYMLNFCIDLLADEDYRSKFFDIIYSDKSFGEKAEEILTLTWPKMMKYIRKCFIEDLKTKGEQKVWDRYGWIRAIDMEKAFQDITKNWNKHLKTVEKVGDISLGVLGLVEGSYYYDISLNFNDSEMEIPTEGLVAYYPFNGNANDESGNGNHGTPTEKGVILDKGVNGNENGAYLFGGYDNPGHICIPNSESLQFHDAATFSVYVKPVSWLSMSGDFGIRMESGGAQCIFAKDHDRNGIVSLLGGNDKKMTVWMCSWGDGNDAWCNLSSGDHLTDNYLNKWTHIAFVYGSSWARMYVDGELVDEKEATPDFTRSNSRPLYIGKFSDMWYPFNGLIDEFRIYNRALTPAEIKALAQFHDRKDASVEGGAGGGTDPDVIPPLPGDDEGM